MDATRLVLRDDPNVTQVLVLTTFDLDEHIYEAPQAGASSSLLTDAPAAIARVRASALVVPSVALGWSQAPRNSPQNAPTLLAGNTCWTADIADSLEYAQAQLVATPTASAVLKAAV